jgi:hypothetical protein
MRAATRERMISIMALVLVISIGFLVPKAAAQSDKYSKMAPVDQYLMERNAEILLARSAAPDSISSDATILILGRQGYETAVRGKNGFVCMVERSWMEAFDSPEFWNPKVKGAECLNRQAARSILPIIENHGCGRPAWSPRFHLCRERYSSRGEVSYQHARPDGHPRCAPKSSRRQCL